MAGKTLSAPPAREDMKHPLNLIARAQELIASWRLTRVYGSLLSPPEDFSDADLLAGVLAELRQGVAADAAVAKAYTNLSADARYYVRADSTQKFWLDSGGGLSWLGAGYEEHNDNLPAGEIDSFMAKMNGCVRGYASPGELGIELDQLENVPFALEHIRAWSPKLLHVKMLFVDTPDGGANVPVLEGEDALDAWWKRNDIRHRVRASSDGDRKFWVTPRNAVEEYTEHAEGIRSWAWSKERPDYDEVDYASNAMVAKGYVRVWLFQDGKLHVQANSSDRVLAALTALPQEIRFANELVVDAASGVSGSRIPVLEGEDALDAWKRRNDVRHRVKAKADLKSLPDFPGVGSAEKLFRKVYPIARGYAYEEDERNFSKARGLGEFIEVYNELLPYAKQAVVRLYRAYGFRSTGDRHKFVEAVKAGQGKLGVSWSWSKTTAPYLGEGADLVTLAADVPQSSIDWVESVGRGMWYTGEAEITLKHGAPVTVVGYSFGGVHKKMGPVQVKAKGIHDGHQVVAAKFSRAELEAQGYHFVEITPFQDGWDSYYGDQELTKKGKVAVFHESDSVEVATLTYRLAMESTVAIIPKNAWVHPAHRRLGLAAALYDFAEEVSGKSMSPSMSQSDDAEAFWKDRKLTKWGVAIKAAGTAHSWGCLMSDFPEDFAKEAQAWSKDNLPDDIIYDTEDHDYGRETHTHVTVAYGIDPKTDPGDIQFNLFQWRKPVEVGLQKITKFDTNPNYDVIKVDVDSQDLHALHEQLKLQVGLPGNTFPDYHPHVTLGYVKKGAADHLLGTTPFAGKKFKLTRFDYSYPKTEGAKDTHVKYDLANLKASQDELGAFEFKEEYESGMKFWVTPEGQLASVEEGVGTHVQYLIDMLREEGLFADVMRAAGYIEEEDIEAYLDEGEGTGEMWDVAFDWAWDHKWVRVWNVDNQLVIESHHDGDVERALKAIAADDSSLLLVQTLVVNDLEIPVDEGEDAEKAWRMRNSIRKTVRASIQAKFWLDPEGEFTPFENSKLHAAMLVKLSNQELHNIDKATQLGWVRGYTGSELLLEVWEESRMAAAFSQIPYEFQVGIKKLVVDVIGAHKVYDLWLDEGDDAEKAWRKRKSGLATVYGASRTSWAAWFSPDKQVLPVGHEHYETALMILEHKLGIVPDESDEQRYRHDGEFNDVDWAIDRLKKEGWVRVRRFNDGQLLLENEFMGTQEVAKFLPLVPQEYLFAKELQINDLVIAVDEDEDALDAWKNLYSVRKTVRAASEGHMRTALGEFYNYLRNAGTNPEPNFAPGARPLLTRALRTHYIKQDGKRPTKKELDELSLPALAQMAKKVWDRTVAGTEDAEAEALKEAKTIGDGFRPKGVLDIHAVQLEELYKKAQTLVQEDPKWEGYNNDPAKAVELGKVQNALRDSRSEAEIQQAWETYQPSISFDELIRQVESKVE